MFCSIVNSPRQLSKLQVGAYSGTSSLADLKLVSPTALTSLIFAGLTESIHLVGLSNHGVAGRLGVAFRHRCSAAGVLQSGEEQFGNRTGECGVTLKRTDRDLGPWR